MALPKQSANIPFVGGIDTKTDPKQVQPIKLLNLENAHFDTVGQLTKRNGFIDSFSQVEFVNNDTIEEAGSVFVKEDQLLLNAKQTLTATGRTGTGDGWRFYSWLEAQDEWIDVGVLEPLELSTFQVSKSSGIDGLGADIPIERHDIATTNGFTCVIKLVYSDVYFTIYDNTTKAKVYDDYGASSATPIESAHVVAVGNSFQIWATDPTNNEIHVRIVDTTSLETPGAWTLKQADLSASDLFDVTICNDIGGFGHCAVVAYKSLTPDVTVRWYNEAGALQATVNLAEIPTNALSCQRIYDVTNTAYRIAVTWQRLTNNDIRYALRNEDSTQYAAIRQLTNVTAAGPDVVRNITCVEDPSLDAAAPGATSTIRWYMEIENNPWAPDQTPWYNFVRQAMDRFGGGATADLDIIYNCGLGSKAFKYDGKARVWLSFDTTLQKSLFLVHAKNGTEQRYDARALYMYGDGNSYGHGLPQVVSDGATVFTTVAVKQDRLQADGTIWRSVVAVEIDYGGNALDRRDVGPTLLVGSGGFVGDFDGKFQENNFHIFPEEPRVAQGTPGVGGDLPQATIVKYKMHYEWFDRKGQIHRSAVSPIKESLTASSGAANNKMDFIVMCIHKGEVEKLGAPFIDGVKIAIFREWTDGLYHRLTSESANDNRVSQAYRNPTDMVWDISANEILYTEGGILEDIGPPATRICAVRQNRAFIVPEEDRELLWYSKEKTEGNAVQFTPYFTRRISAGGEIIALEELDEKLIIFKRREIHALGGRGPEPTGQGSQFTEAFQITTDVGCVNRRSVVRMSKGIMFQSEKGIYLLTRGLEVVYIGAPVEYYNSIPIMKAFEVDHKNQIRFLLRIGGMLVYDHLVDQWSVTTSTDWGGLDFMQDCEIWQNEFYLLDENGVLKRETSAGYNDNGDYIPMEIETAWFKMADLQGFQRLDWISFIGEWISSHTLTVDVYVNYVDTVAYTKTLAANAAFGGNAPYQFRFKPADGYAKCESIKFRIVDADDGGAGSGQGFSLSGVAFDYKVKKGLYKQAGYKTL